MLTTTVRAVGAHVAIVWQPLADHGSRQGAWSLRGTGALTGASALPGIGILAIDALTPPPIGSTAHA